MRQWMGCETRRPCGESLERRPVLVHLHMLEDTPGYLKELGALKFTLTRDPPGFMYSNGCLGYTNLRRSGDGGRD